MSQTTSAPQTPSEAAGRGLPRAGLGRVLVGLAGLLVWPAAIVADTALAVERGWPLAAAGGFRLLYPLAAALAGALVVLLVFPFYRRWLARRARQCWLLAGSLGLGWVAGEALLAIAAPAPPEHARTPGAVYEFHPGQDLAGVVGAARHALNRQGLRGSDPPAGQVYRIVCLGGSTTECVYLDDSECWPRLLEVQLARAEFAPVWVASAGHGDLASGHHLRFAADSPLLEGVDCLLVMPGVNDLVRTLKGIDHGDVAPPLWHRSRVVEAARYAWNAGPGQAITYDETGEIHSFRRRWQDIDEPAQPIDFDAALDAYAARLARLVEAARARGLRLVLVTQPVHWEVFLSPAGYKQLLVARQDPFPRDWLLLQAKPLRELMDRYNERTRQVGSELGVEMVDAAARFNGKEELYYDDYHFNEHGCYLLAKLLTEHFVAHTVGPPRPTGEAAGRRRPARDRDDPRRGETPLDDQAAEGFAQANR